LGAYMRDMQDKDIRRESFRTTPLERTFQGQLLPMIEALTRQDPGIKSFLNIGVHYGYIDNVLAQKYPRCRFTGVDFPANTAEFNDDFRQPNLEFRAGYALDLLEKGELSADVAWFCSVAYEIKNKEVREYLTVLKKRVRYVIFNEPIYILPGGAVLDPCQVPSSYSEPVYSHKVHLANRVGPLAYVHNYKALAEECGLEILHYKVFKPEFSNLRLVQMVAATKLGAAAQKQAA
jgi:hypothetical protein